MTGIEYEDILKEADKLIEDYLSGNKSQELYSRAQELEKEMKEIAQEYQSRGKYPPVKIAKALIDISNITREVREDR